MSKEDSARISSDSHVSPTAETATSFEDVKIHYDKPWYRIPHFIRLSACIFLITLSSSTNGYDGSMLNGFQSLESWASHMGRPKGAILGALTNGTIFGGVLATPFASYVNDVWGRKWGIVIGESITVLGAILQGASTNYAFFIVARMVLGFGSFIAVVGSAPLISEISYPDHRPAATALYNTCWYLGALIAAGVTYGTKNMKGDNAWRIPSYIQAALPAVQVLLFWVIPESPRFLVNKGKIEEARAILLKHHCGGDESPEAQALVDFEIREIQTAIEMEKLQESTKFRDFLTTAGNRKRLFIVFIIPSMMQLSGNGLVSYYLNLVLNSIGITSTDQQLRINVALMGYNWGCAMISAAFAHRFKRRHMFLASTASMCLLYIIWTVLSAINQKGNFENKGLGKGVLAMIFLYYFAYNAGLNGLPYLYITEILTYSLRAKGLTIMQSWTQVVLVYNGFVNPVAMDAITWKYYIVFVCILACEVPIVYFFFPETSGYTLEEVATVFGDDPQDLHHVISAARDAKQSLDHVEEA